MKNLIAILFIFFAVSCAAQQKFITISPSAVVGNNDVLQYKINRWMPRTLAQLATDLNYTFTFDTTHIYNAIGLRIRYIDSSNMLRDYRDGLNARELLSNKSTNTSLGTSDVLYPSQKAVKTYVDAHAGGAADTVSLSDRINAKQDALGFTAVPNTRTVNGHALSGNISIVNTDIAEDGTHRWTTDAEKTTWNGKQDALGFTAVPNTRTVNGHALSSNVTVSLSDVGYDSTTDHAQLITAINARATNSALTSGLALKINITDTASYFAALEAAINARQPVNTLLSQLSALSFSDGEFLQYQSGALANITAAQLKTALSLSAADFSLDHVENYSSAEQDAVANDLKHKDINLDSNHVHEADATIFKASAIQTVDLSLYETLAHKDATGGYAGLTLFKINFKNAANTFTNFLTNATTAARTYTFPDKSMTVADAADVTANGVSIASNTTAIAAINQHSPSDQLLTQMGIPAKQHTWGVDFGTGTANTALALTDNVTRLTITTPVGSTNDTIRGLTFFQIVQGAYTSDNENRLSVWELDTTACNYNLLGTTANTGALYTGTALSFVKAPITSGSGYVVLYPGHTYYFGLTANWSANTIVPTVLAGATTASATYVVGPCAGVRFTNSKSATNTVPSTIATSGTTSVNDRILIIGY